MKQIILFFLSLIIVLNSNGQKVQTIRFIYWGDENQPIGTVLISTGKYVKPLDKSNDAVWGVGVKTDTATFNVTKEFLINNKYTTPDSARLKEFRGYYQIIGSDGTDLFLIEPNITPFSKDFKLTLNEKKVDPAVIEVFKYRL